MKKLTLISAILFIAVTLYGQITFEKTYGSGKGICVEQTSDDGYILLTTYPGILYNDWNCLIKTNEYGDTLWTKYLGNYGLYELNTLCLTSDGGYLLVGGPSNIYGFEMLIARLNNVGDTIWTKSNPFGETGGAQSVVRTTDNHYIIVYGSSIIAKINDNGDSLWTRQYNLNEDIFEIKNTVDNGFIIAGSNLEDNYGVIRKTDSLGNQEWIKTYNNLILRSICQTNDNGFMATGDSNSDVYILRSDSLGNEMWNEMYDFGGNDEGYSICETENNSYVIAVESNMGHLFKIDDSGEIIWSQIYGEGLFDVKVTNDNGLIATGLGQVGGQGGAYLLKTNQDGLITSIPTNQEKRLSILNVFPNPADKSTKLSYNIESNIHVVLSVHDAKGTLVENLVDEDQVLGKHEAIWYTNDIPPGIYFCTLKVGNAILTKKIIKQ